MSRNGPRATPYALVFGQGGLEQRLDDIRAEAAERGTGLGDPAQFVMFTETGRFIRELLPEDADPASVLDAGRLIFHAYRFREAGGNTYALEPAVLGALLTDTLAGEATSSGAPVESPAPAGYLQLPRHALWARVAEEAPWEAVDGVFWALGPGGPEARLALQALLVLGMRPDRPGFSVVPVEAADLPETGDWSDIQARSEGKDFENVLPGGELSGLHALLNGAEVLKLLSRFFRHVASHPEAVEPEALAGATGEAAATERRFRVRAG